MTYENLKKLIQLKNLNEAEKQSLLNKIDMFLLFDRITQEQYHELYELLNLEANE